MKKNILMVILFTSTLTMMFGKVFNKPDQYHYVEEKGFLTQEEYASFNRYQEARNEYDLFDLQINTWYDNGKELLIIQDVDFMMNEDLNEHFRQNTNSDSAINSNS